MCTIVFFWNKEKESCRKKQKMAEEDSKKEYSAIIQRLVLFLETGMSIPAAMEEIYREYKSRKKEMFVYEVIGKSCRQLQLGAAQEEVFQNIGSQVRLEPYRKLSAILIQNITRGSDELFVQLKSEEEQAFFERKEQAKRKGEEASTKLLGTNDHYAGCDSGAAYVSGAGNIYIKEEQEMKRFLTDESGMGVVEVILIIVVLIGLVIIFQTQIKTVVNNIFKTITSKTGQVK